MHSICAAAAVVKQLNEAEWSAHKWFVIVVRKKMCMYCSLYIMLGLPQLFITMHSPSLSINLYMQLNSYLDSACLPACKPSFAAKCLHILFVCFSFSRIIYGFSLAIHNETKRKKTKLTQQHQNETREREREKNRMQSKSFHLIARLCACGIRARTQKFRREEESEREKQKMRPVYCCRCANLL